MTHLEMKKAPAFGRKPAYQKTIFFIFQKKITGGVLPVLPVLAVLILKYFMILANQNAATIATRLAAAANIEKYGTTYLVSISNMKTAVLLLFPRKMLILEWDLTAHVLCFKAKKAFLIQTHSQVFFHASHLFAENLTIQTRIQNAPFV